jgi:hypothetical protein
MDRLVIKLSAIPTPISAMVSRSAICVILVLAGVHTGIAQTGKVSILCENPTNPTDKVVVDIDYDHRVASARNFGPTLQVNTFDANVIFWQTAGNHFNLNRSTGVLDRIAIAPNLGYHYNCKKFEAPKF